jgi:hypothetical protein
MTNLLLYDTISISTFNRESDNYRVLMENSPQYKNLLVSEYNPTKKFDNYIPNNISLLDLQDNNLTTSLYRSTLITNTNSPSDSFKHTPELVIHENQTIFGAVNTTPVYSNERISNRQYNECMQSNSYGYGGKGLDPKSVQLGQLAITGYQRGPEPLPLPNCSSPSSMSPNRVSSWSVVENDTDTTRNGYGLFNVDKLYTPSVMNNPNGLCSVLKSGKLGY